MKKGLLKYIILSIIACCGAVIIYYAVVPEEKRIPFGIEVDGKNSIEHIK